MVKGIVRFAVFAAVAVGAPQLAAAQTRLEPKIDDPLTRSFYWFRYVAGADIRERCPTGQLNHIRLVYNAIWNEHVRAYDIALRGGSGATMVTRVLTKLGDVSSIEVRDWNGLLDPWRGKRAEVRLSASDVARLTGLLQDSGGFGPPPAGLELPSNDYWWTVASCRNGRWGFAAYHYPTDKFARVRFAQALFAADGTGVPATLPKDLPPAIFRGDRTRQWRLAVGRDGLRDY
ncbi:MAG: hypothetical protein KIT36_13250 [Alphaproteobacteria bacterium]|nr:hypothetical protein [Alphaproteobacteria bacterium]